MSYKVWMKQPKWFSTLEEANACWNDYFKSTGCIVAITYESHKVTHTYELQR